MKQTAFFSAGCAALRQKLLCMAAVLLFCLCCTAAPQGAAAEQPLNIVTTIFPAYDFARQAAGSGAEVSMLIPPGADSHSYEPSPRDILSIQSADLFIYTGGESDTWLEKLLASMGSDAPRTLRMMDAVNLLAQEHTASMGEHHHHDHAHDEETCSDSTHHHGEEMDEHVWTSPRNAALIVNAVADKLAAIRPEQAESYRSNAAAYAAEIGKIDLAFREIVANAERDLIIFGDRFPLRYFAAEYGLRYDAAFPGCSEDSEPSVRTVISLVDTVRREGVPVVFHIEYSSQKTARILAEETGARLRLFHGCHTVSAAEIEAGATYVSLMRQNVEALKEALN
jgi:zinc transport system substrate-binding protein